MAVCSGNLVYLWFLALLPIHLTASSKLHPRAEENAQRLVRLPVLLCWHDYSVTVKHISVESIHYQVPSSMQRKLSFVLAGDTMLATVYNSLCTGLLIFIPGYWTILSAARLHHVTLL